ncbi:MAG: hypothetical protein KA734_06790 [Fluviicola sp.]|nr:hypothetical protein [Fluviicola sp.]
MIDLIKNILRQKKQGEVPTKSLDKAYLKTLVENLIEVKAQGKTIPFTIQALKADGFQIKIGGLFGFVPFERMPWTYKDKALWKSFEPYLIGCKFFGSIDTISDDPFIQVFVDGQQHRFQQDNRTIGGSIQAIVTHKTNYGVFLEAGFNWNWEFGSFIGLAHKLTFSNASTYENCKKGDVIITRFHGFNEQQKPIFGDNVKHLDFLTGKVNDYINKIVNVTVIKFSNNRKEYFVDDCYPANLVVTKLIYPDNKKQIKKTIANFFDNEIITCEVIGVNTKKRKFELKLLEN